MNCLFDDLFFSKSMSVSFDITVVSFTRVLEELDDASLTVGYVLNPEIPRFLKILVGRFFRETI